MPTIKDVARLAGVTVTTVSRVLNNRGYISDATRQKVYQAMEELNYQPNEIARSLHRRQSKLIGLIIPTVSHPFFGELAGFIEYYAHLIGYKVLICNSLLDRKKEKEYIEMLKSNRVDGIIMGSHTLEVEEYMNLNYPIVTFDRRISEEIPYISSDNYGGGKLATHLLIQKGCKKIAHISGNLQLQLLANKRSQAFIELSKEHGIESVIVETELNVFDITQYEAMIRHLLEKHPDIDGIFASSDIMAAYVIQICHFLNRRIPEHIKIVGYDDIKLASLFVPPLTTIRQPMEEMTKRAVELIVKQVNEEPFERENVFPVELIERLTT